MGKIRVATLGDESEKEQKRRAEARRQTKKSKKEKVEGVGLKGGQRVAVIEGTDIKPEFKKLVEEVESGQEPSGLSDQTSDKTRKRKKVKSRARSKRYQEAIKLVDRATLYPLSEAVALIKQTSLSRFDGTVELHVNLSQTSLGEKKDLPAGRQDFRGSVSLPHGTGKQVRVAVADDAILSKLESGVIEFDVLVAHPSVMSKLAKYAKLLGPRGLMPNPKTGTIGEDPEKLALGLRKGKVNFKTEPDHPIIHMVVGKVSFEDTKIIENTNAILDAIGRGKIAKATLASTMGPGIKLALS